MKSLSLKAKLFLVLGILTTVAVVVAFLGISKLAGMNNRLNGIVNGSALKVKLGARINQDLLAVSRAEKNIILADTQEQMDRYAEFTAQTLEEMKKRRAELRELVDETGKVKLDEFATKWDKYMAVNKEVVALARLNSNVVAKNLSGNDGREAYDKSEDIMRAIANLNDQEVTNQAQLANDSATRVLLGARTVQDLLRIHRAEKNVILEDDKAKMQEYNSARKEFVTSADGAVAELQKSVTTEGRTYLDNFVKAYDNFKNRSEKVVSLAFEDKNAEAKTLSAGEGREAYDNAEKALKNLVDLNDRMNSEAAKATDEAASRALICARVIQDMLALHRAEKNLILETTDEGMAKYIDAIRGFKADINAKIAEFEKTASTEGKAKLADFKTSWAKFLEINDKVCATSRENGNTKAFLLASTKGREINDECAELMKTIVDKNDEEMATDSEISDKNYAAAKWLMLTVSIVGILSAITLAMFVISGTIKAFRNLFGGLKSFSAAELEETAQTFGRIIEGLTDGSEQVASASGQVSSASQSLAEGATEQAAGLEETSSSLEEMSSMTKQNADNAQQANTLATDASKLANNGADAMKRMNEAIHDIQKSSDETAKIIKVIDEIAFQTNLLALNAAVEAARAGEAGKGFAVVAEEVRNLAMRSAEAAKNTANMIEESVKNSKNGVDIANEVGKVLEEIVQGIGKTTDLVGEIAAASQEQAQGIDQVNTAVAQMDKVTQQNAANAEESASASEELSAQAEQMNSVVEELSALVGSNKARNNTVRSKSAVGKQRSLSNTDHLYHNIADSSKSKKQPKAKAAAKKSSAEKSIPLDDKHFQDGDINDFNS